MAGETPFRKRRPWRRHGHQAQQDGIGGTGPAEGGHASAERSAAPPDHSGGSDDERGRSASLEVARAAALPDLAAQQEQQNRADPTTGGRLHAVKQGRTQERGEREGTGRPAGRPHHRNGPARAGARPRHPPQAVPRARSRGAGRQAGHGSLPGHRDRRRRHRAAAMMPVPPAMLAELAAEVTGVAAIEMKLVAELHEVYGLRPGQSRPAQHRVSHVVDGGARHRRHPAHHPQRRPRRPDEA